MEQILLQNKNGVVVFVLTLKDSNPMAIIVRLLSGTEIAVLDCNRQTCVESMLEMVRSLPCVASLQCRTKFVAEPMGVIQEEAFLWQSGPSVAEFWSLPSLERRKKHSRNRKRA